VNQGRRHAQRLQQRLANRDKLPLDRRAELRIVAKVIYCLAGSELFDQVTRLLDIMQEL
jgi:hypothetical protein